MRAAVSFEHCNDFSFWQSAAGDFWLSVTGAARRILYPRRKLAWFCGGASV
jgi:hypothetical protein